MTSTNQVTNQHTSCKPTNRLRPNQLTKVFLFLFFLLAYSLQPATYSLASDFAGSLKGVTITDSGGTNTPPEAVISFTQSEDTVDFDASGSTDDGSIVEYQWDFGDGATGTGVNVSHQYTTGVYLVTLAAVDNNGGVALVQESISLAPAFSIAVNFQPVGSDVPDGFVADSGGSFDGAVGYGWVQFPTLSKFRDRDNVISQDQSYDTLVYLNKGGTPSAIWELDLPSGTYNITICMGDPTYGNDLQNVQVEGQTIINESLTDTNRWVENTSSVVVDDGRLTLTFTGSDTYARLCWVKVVSL